MFIPAGLMADLIAAMPLSDRIEIVDVGASNVSAKELPSYDALLTHGLGRLTAFEPNPAELEKLQPSESRRYLPYAIGTGNSVPFHITQSPGFCSTLRPDPKINAAIHSFGPLTEVLSVEKMKTKRLDDLDEISRVDFLKIDIQGGEVAAFKGGNTKLSQLLCAQSEVAFVPIYEKQPLFAQQDEVLQSFGLRFFGMTSVHRYAYEGASRGIRKRSRRHDIGQWVDADAVYLRDFIGWDTLPTEDIKRLFFIVLTSFSAASATMRLGQLLVDAKVLTPALLAQLETHLTQA
jgi:FkbM family methyltransferase